MTFAALIPARAGSTRVPGKNTRLLNGHPLLAYAAAAARASQVCSSIYLASDSDEILAIGARYGAIPFLRSPAGADEPDIVWVTQFLEAQESLPDAFAILRPTSPFRTADTIRRAWAQFQSKDWQDSLRAVERWDGPHPGKMWRARGKRIDGMVPVMPDCHPDGTPYHSSPTQSLPIIYRQNASLEIARTEMCLRTHTIAGTRVMPFLTQGYEGFDINIEADWADAERLVATGQVRLPSCTEIGLPA